MRPSPAVLLSCAALALAACTGGDEAEIVIDCAAAGAPAPAREPGDLVAEGAIAARYCGPWQDRPGLTGPGTRDPGGPVRTDGVAELVTRLNALPAEPELCTPDRPPVATLVLAYPGGGRAVVSFEEGGGCSAVWSGDVVRYGEFGS